jgi:PhnB protein
MATKATNPIPKGYHSITPYLICKGAASAIDWYKKALGAEELFRMPGPDGTLGHAEIKLGDSVVMLADEFPQMGAKSPATIGGTPVSLMLYVKDSDAVFKNAVAAGAKVKGELKDQFYGDRSGMIEDPYGHIWTISTHVEDVSPDEMARRSAEAMKSTK